MAIHKNFPKSPYAILDPDIRWFPAEETSRLHGLKTLLPPLVYELRRKVKEWRDSDYAGASATSKALLHYWFETDHQFQYYFCQREAVETVIYLHDIVQVKDKYDLMRFDSSGAVSGEMFDESWRRFVIKMATGSGKTKVLSLLVAWSFFHKLYEEKSDLSRNFLIITPNIIVLDRIRADFDGLKIFFQDPILPPNGFDGKNWTDDFQMRVHLQDELGSVRKVGNIFLSNIHRVYDTSRTPASGDSNSSEYFLGPKPVAETGDSKVGLSDIVRDVDELMVLNDEAHHIHDKDMAWFKSIQDINNQLLQKGGALSMQIDVTATPKGEHGAIFVQTVCDYPLVEAIFQDIVKHPILPDAASRGKLSEKISARYSERFEQYIHLGYLEWKKVYDEQLKLGKKAVLFIMTDDTKNCDEVAQYLETRYPELQNAVLTIHTKNNGEISETAKGKDKEELDRLRKAANEIDKLENPHKAIVSVMMLKEGWDVRNVTTIVGLRAYTVSSNILPEQTLGRGLRRMYPASDISEFVCVIGTPNFMEFVESIKTEGVEIELCEMGERTPPRAPLIVEVDRSNTKKDLKQLDIVVPILSPRIFRNYKNLSDLDISKIDTQKITYKQFSEEEKKEIVFVHVIFKDGDREDVHHRTIIDGGVANDYISVVGYFTRAIMKDLRLVSGYDILYPKVLDFIQYHLFDKSVDMADSNTLRNLSEVEATKTIIETFKKAINALTISDRGDARIMDCIKLTNVRPFAPKYQGYFIPKKSVFNKIIGDSGLELEFAAFLDTDCDDIISYAKNYLAVHFQLEYQDASGDMSSYYPDFIVKKTDSEIFIVETKGQEDVNVSLKMGRLKRWCVDVNNLSKGVKYDYVFVDEEGFKKYRPKDFSELVRTFRKYK